MRKDQELNSVRFLAFVTHGGRSDLSCACKDAYRVFVFEYALERLPAVLPINGMASRIVTYARKKPNNASGDGNSSVGGGLTTGGQLSDIVYLPRDEPPPLYSGDLPFQGTPVSVVESTLFAAPCKAYPPGMTDFLVVQKESHLYVREIDEIVSVSVTIVFQSSIFTKCTRRFQAHAFFCAWTFLSLRSVLRNHVWR